MARIVVTGANSAVGRVVVERVLERDDLELLALVRSPAAAGQVPPIPPDRGRVAVVGYEDAAGFAFALEGAAALIHLPGLLIETQQSTYQKANVDTTRAAVEAARSAGLSKFVLVSAVGAYAESTNRYFASKGEAEHLVAASGLAYTILRCPMVLACRSHGVRALVRETGQRLVPLIGGGRNHDQPIDARDLADGALNAAVDAGRARDTMLLFVGPESLPMRELIRRGARLRGRTSSGLSIPRRLVRALLRLRALVTTGGLTPDVLDVMLLDVNVDAKPAAEALGVELRTLDETLRDSLALWENA